MDETSTDTDDTDGPGRPGACTDPQSGQQRLRIVAAILTQGALRAAAATTATTTATATATASEAAS
jgi:hypothetical protein